MDILRHFYNNPTMRDGVHEYLVEHVKNLAVEKALKREDTSHIADAMEAINSAFDELDEEFNEKKPRTVDSPIR